MGDSKNSLIGYNYVPNIYFENQRDNSDITTKGLLSKKEALDIYGIQLELISFESIILLKIALNNETYINY